MRYILVHDRNNYAETMGLMLYGTPATSSHKKKTVGRRVVYVRPSLSSPNQYSPGMPQGVRLVALESPTKRTYGRKRAREESSGTLTGCPQQCRSVDHNACIILEQIKSDPEGVWKVVQA